jgi:hypothetical protein
MRLSVSDFVFASYPMKRLFGWILAIFGPAALLALFFTENIKRLFEQEGWNRLLANWWHPILDSFWTAITSVYAIFFGSFLAGVALAAVASVLWAMRRKPKSDHAPVSLSEALYVGEIRVSVEQIKDERHSEIIMRVFNGSWSAAKVAKVSGQIKYSGKGGEGTLPTPRVRSDATIASPFKEGLLLLNQHVPAEDAAKLSATLEDSGTIYFDLRQLKIEVSDGTGRSYSLGLWGGVTATKTAVAYGRIVPLSAAVRI